MAIMGNNPSLVLLHLEAKTPAALSLKMMENNLSHQTTFVYMPPQKVGGIWICWYQADITLTAHFQIPLKDDTFREDKKIELPNEK